MDGVKLGLIRLQTNWLESFHMNGCRVTPPAGGLDMPGEEPIAELCEVRSRRVYLWTASLDC
jgi:hypothetical protein